MSWEMTMTSTYAEHPIVIGLDSFGDMTVGTDATFLSQPQNIRELVAEGVLAESSSLDYFGLGEHHIEEIPLSAPDMVLPPSPLGPHASTWDPR